MGVINNDTSLIPSTKIYVPKIDRDVFIEGFIEYLRANYDEDDFSNDFATMKDALTFDDDNINITEELQLFSTDNVKLDTENTFITKDSYIYNYFNSLLGVNTLSNGVVFLGVLMGGDWEIPAFKIFYFDGTRFKSYVPRFGNAINCLNNSAFGNEPNEDDSYLQQFNLTTSDLSNMDLNKIIDESLILQDLENVFELKGSFNGTIKYLSNNTTSNNNFNGNSSTQKNLSITDVLLQIFESKNYSLISTFQQSLINQGFVPYDKNLCWKNLNDKDKMLKDIYNYILHFDNNGNATYKYVECQKIVTYIKKYKYKFEGYLY